MKKDSHDVDANIPHPVESNLSGSPRGFESSSRLRARIEKLAPWRIDPSAITFPEGAREFRGGHAKVSEAHMDRSQLERWGGISIVAVKNPITADDTDFEQALGLAIREAEFLAKLSHRNIVGFEGFVEDASKSIIWLVFPWADNGNLKDFISLVDWEVPERISLISDVVEGLAYLHSRNPPVCHGDLKSLNVLVDLHCCAAITDFGSARRLAHHDPYTQIKQLDCRAWSSDPVTASYSAFTNTITLTGNKYTIRWAAPELLNEDHLSLWSDIWALGWIAYEVMTNFIPFQDAATDIVVVERVLTRKLPSLTDNADLLFLNELCLLMNMCWQSDPMKRPTAGHCRKYIEHMRRVIPAFEFMSPSRNSSSRFRSTELLGELGCMHQSRLEYARAFDFFVEALENSRSFEQAEKTVSSLCDLAQLHRLREEYTKAVPLYSEALEISTELGDRQGRAHALCGLAEVYRLLYLGDEAAPLYSEALGIHTELGDRQGRAHALRGLAGVYRLQSMYNEATSLYVGALEIHTDLGDRQGIVDTLRGLADVYPLQSLFYMDHSSSLIPRAIRYLHNKAVSLYSKSLEILSDFRDRRDRTYALCALADVYRFHLPYHEDPIDSFRPTYHRDLYKKAASLYSEALEIHTDLGDRRGRADTLCALADVYQRQRLYNHAIPLYSEALEIRTDLGDRQGRFDALSALADLTATRSRFPGLCSWEFDLDNRTTVYPKHDALLGNPLYCEITSLYSTGLEVRIDLKDRQGKVDAIRGLSPAYLLQGEYNRAIPLYSEALEICSALGNGQDMACVLWGLAVAYGFQGEYNKAVLLYAEALKICAVLGIRREPPTKWDFSSIDWPEIKSTVDMLVYFEQEGDELLDLQTKFSCDDKCSQVTLFRSETLKLHATLKRNRQGRPSALWGLAQVHRLLGKYDEAIPLYSEALEIYTALGDRQGRAGVLLGLAVAYRLQGEFHEAIPLCFEALDIYTALRDRQGRANALWDLAVVYRRQGEYNKAMQHYSEALEIRNDLGDRQGRANALCGLADIHRLLGEYDQAIRLYSNALKILNHLGERQGRSETILRYLRLLQVLNHERPVRWRSRILLSGLGNRRRTRLQLPKFGPTQRNA